MRHLRSSELFVWFLFCFVLHAVIDLFSSIFTLHIFKPIFEVLAKDALLPPDRQHPISL